MTEIVLDIGSQIRVYKNYGVINCTTYRPVSVSKLKMFFVKIKLFGICSLPYQTIEDHLPSCLRLAMFTYSIHGGLIPLYYNMYNLQFSSVSWWDHDRLTNIQRVKYISNHFNKSNGFLKNMLSNYFQFYENFIEVKEDKDFLNIERNNHVFMIHTCWIINVRKNREFMFELAGVQYISTKSFVKKIKKKKKNALLEKEWIMIQNIVKVLTHLNKSNVEVAEKPIIFKKFL
ncbi:hypothetical protein V1477_014445 [Vespula maculifrons]|uniref:Uncharacterized protein n=1 Tax=Vespula maculifrons TaxID=7453 RepID=A0ABD2BL47_VESMC